MTDGGGKELGVRDSKLQYEELEEFCIKLVELSKGVGETKVLRSDMLWHLKIV